MTAVQAWLGPRLFGHESMGLMTGRKVWAAIYHHWLSPVVLCCMLCAVSLNRYSSTQVGTYLFSRLHPASLFQSDAQYSWRQMTGPILTSQKLTYICWLYEAKALLRLRLFDPQMCLVRLGFTPSQGFQRCLTKQTAMSYVTAPVGRVIEVGQHHI